jgi:hypothetical protein
MKGIHVFDDLTIGASGTNMNDIAKTVLYFADFTGKQIVEFTVDGTTMKSVDVYEGLELLEPTSVRYGKGPGFSSSSLYLTEGGGATPHVTSRRVVQL